MHNINISLHFSSLYRFFFWENLPYIGNYPCAAQVHVWCNSIFSVSNFFVKYYKQQKGNGKREKEKEIKKSN